MFNPFLGGLKNRLCILSDDVALIECKSDRRITSAELWRGSQRAAHALVDNGVSDRDYVVVTMMPDERYCQIIYGLFLIGAIPVFIDPATDQASLNECINELSPKLWISDSRLNFDMAVHVDNIFIDKNLSPGLQDIDLKDMRSNETCLMIYTSGTTGLPKGVPWTCANISSYLNAQISHYEEFNIRTEFALFAHLAISAISIGRCCILPSLDNFQPGKVDMKAAVEQMIKYGCDYVFGSPTYWRRLSNYCNINGIKIPGAKIVSTAGASVNCKILERVSAVLPNAKIRIPYASTEVLMPISTLDLSELSHLTRVGTSEGRGIPIGRAVEDMRVEAIPSNLASDVVSEDRFLSAGIIGELIVSGPRVTNEYFKRPSLSREAKVTDTKGTIWHRMGDIGYIDGSGMIWFLSRKKDVRVINGNSIYPDQQEQFYNHQLGIEECAVVRIQSTDRVALIIPVEFIENILERDVQGLAELHDFPVPVVSYYHDRLPTDSRHNSKINRAFLEAWVQPVADKICIEGSMA